MERVQTGIKGLDEMIQGGIPKGSSVLLTGGSGTGKTIFALQYIYEGAKTYKEPGIFITLEGNVKNITWNMESFNWDIKSLQEKNLVKIYRLNLDPSRFEDSFDELIDKELEVIAKMAKDMGAVRLAVDSTTAFGLYISEEGLMRSLLFKFTNSLKDLNCTSLLIAETSGEKNKLSAFGVEEFVTDGVIALFFMPPHRSMFVRKMRGTNHSKSVHPFEITDRAISVNYKDELLWEVIR